MQHSVIVSFKSCTVNIDNRTRIFPFGRYFYQTKPFRSTRDRIHIAAMVGKWWYRNRPFFENVNRMCPPSWTLTKLLFQFNVPPVSISFVSLQYDVENSTKNRNTRNPKLIRHRLYNISHYKSPNPTIINDDDVVVVIFIDMNRLC